MNRLRDVIWGLPFVLSAAMLFVLHPDAAVAQESPSFRMERITIASTADAAGSASFATMVTGAQEGPVGSASRCNDSWVQSTGYWSLLGELPVPVLLAVDRNEVDAEMTDLTWTGAAPEFTVYRAVSPVDLADPLNATVTTTACATTDSPPIASIVYYLVLPGGS